MSFQGFYTTKGLALAAKIAAGTKLTITKVTAGSGETAKSATALAGEKQALTVGTAAVSGQSAILPVTLAETSVSAAYALTELGVYAQDPDAGEILFQVFRMDTAVPLTAGGESTRRFYLKQTVGTAGISVTCSSAGLLIDEDLAPTRSKVLALSVPSRSISLAATEIQAYLDALPRLLTENLTFNLSGTVPELLTVRNFYGPGKMNFNIQSGQSCTFAKGLLVQDCELPIEVSGVSITPDTAKASPVCVEVLESKFIQLSSCTITGNSASIGISVYRGSLALVENCTMTDHKTCAQATRGGRLCVSNTSGKGTYSGNKTGAYVWWGGTILLCEAAPDLLGGTANIHSGGLIVNAKGTVI